MSERSPNPWYALLVVGSLAMEAVFLMVGGALVGMKVDDIWLLQPWGKVGGLVLGFLCTVLSFVYTLRRFLRSE